MNETHDGVPAVYRRFRDAWTLVHVLLVLAGTAALVWWGLSDGNAERLWYRSWGALFEFQQAAAGIVSWPWES